MVAERNDSHRKTIVLLKRNVNFLLTGTVVLLTDFEWSISARTATIA